MATETTTMCRAPTTGVRVLSLDYSQMQLQDLIGIQDVPDDMAAPGLQCHQMLISENPVCKALKERNVEWARKLLRIGNMALLPSTDGIAPLHVACMMDMDEMARELLAMGADMNARDQQECTPLFHAVCAGSTKCVQLLIEAGCDVDAVTLEQVSAMDQALVCRRQDIVALLLRAGCTTHNLTGHRLYREDSSNSFFCALWEKQDLDNMQLFLDCGYQVMGHEMSALKSTCYQLRVHKVEKDTLEVLKNFTEKPRSLGRLCRTHVRQMLMETRCQTHRPMDAMISSLPLPGPLKQFLMLKDSRSEEAAFSNICE